MYKDKLEKAKGLFAQAKVLLAKPEISAEDKAAIEQLMVDAKALQVEASQLKEIEAAAVAIDEATKATKVTEDKSVVGPSDKGSKFSSWGEFLFASWEASKTGKIDPRLQAFEDDEPKTHEGKATLGEAVGARGGFLVPTEFRAELMSEVAENSIVRSRATVIPMRRRQVDIPVLDQTGTTAGQPHWFGGMRFYWAEESAQKTQSEPTFRQISLIAHKMIGYTRSSDELLDDSAISLEAFLGGPLGMVGGISWMEDFAFLQGDGAGKPLGVLNAGATIVQPRAADGEITFPDLANMMEDFLPTGQGVWVFTQSALSDLIQMTGPAGNPSYVWAPFAVQGAAGSIPGSLFGYPVIWTEKLPALGVQGDVLLADFRYYLLGDRQSTTVESTKFDRWQFDETSWRAVHRVDGQPWLSAPLTLQDGATQVSPFVILGDKSS